MNYYNSLISRQVVPVPRLVHRCGHGQALYIVGKVHGRSMEGLWKVHERFMEGSSDISALGAAAEDQIFQSKVLARSMAGSWKVHGRFTRFRIILRITF